MQFWCEVVAHVLNRASVFVPTAFNPTFTPLGDAPIANTDTSAKAAPISGTLTCTIPLQTLFFGAASDGHDSGDTGLYTAAIDGPCRRLPAA